jgi:arylsulfatase A-like enzyme
MECLIETWEKYRDKPLGEYHKIDAFAAMTEDMDTAIGSILDNVARLGICGDTYIFFTSDNGGVATEPDRNHPLRAGKGTLYEGGLRVPFIVAGPGIEPGSVNATPVVGWDLCPTFAELAGGRVELDYAIDGVSFAGVLTGKPAGAALTGRTLVFHSPFHRNHMSAMRKGNLKFVRVWDEDTAALYDLEADIGETHNLADERPKLAQEMEATMLDYLRNVDARFWKPRKSK